MAIINSRLLSPDEAIKRKIRREHETAQTTLVLYVNSYLTSLNEFNGDKELALPFYRKYDRAWRTFVVRWNETPSRLSELRGSDYEDFINAHFKKLKQNGKNKIWKTCGAMLRPIVDCLWVCRSGRQKSNG